mgnify:CR=1 FL=1
MLLAITVTGDEMLNAMKVWNAWATLAMQTGRHGI